jgi:hypothetical protein
MFCFYAEVTLEPERATDLLRGVSHYVKLPANRHVFGYLEPLAAAPRCWGPNADYETESFIQDVLGRELLDSPNKGAVTNFVFLIEPLEARNPADLPHCARGRADTSCAP